MQLPDVQTRPEISHVEAGDAPVASSGLSKAPSGRYAVGYMLHFILGHFVPVEDSDRAEGCNVVGSLFSDLGRFLSFVLVVSISMKVGSVARSPWNVSGGQFLGCAL